MKRTIQLSMAYREFRQIVRRYRPSDLIPALAGYSAEAFREGEWPDPTRNPPWAIAAIARESILYGNDHRHTPVDRGTVRQLVGAFNKTYDKVDGTAGILTPLAYEQFPYQESPIEELSRVHALFEDSALGPALDWSEVFGMPLYEAVRAAFALRVWVTEMGGRFDPAIMDLAHIQEEIFEKVAPREQIEKIAAVLTTTVVAAKEMKAAVPALDRSLQRWEFNPLAARPLVDLGERGIWAPQVMLVDRALYPANLYYRGVDTWGADFARVLGARTEAYVGKQLGLVADENDLHSEITYKPGKSEVKSVDWIWVTPQAVILVECKSARLTLGARAGDPTLPAIAERYLTKAREQLDRTANLISARTPPFDQFPDDRPIVGLAVTCEPIYLGNSNLNEYGIRSTIPSLSLSLRELEQWVCFPASDVVGKLLEILNDPERRTWLFGVALGELPDTPNPILEASWKKSAFLVPEIE